MNNGWLLPPVALFPLDLDREMARRYVPSACVSSGRRRRGRSRIGLFGSERWHIRQFRQIAVLPVSILEFGFPTSGIRTHPLPFGIWQHRLLQMGTGEFGTFFPQRAVQ